MSKKNIIVLVVFVFLLLFLSEFAYPEEIGNFKKIAENKQVAKVKTQRYKWEFSTAVSLGLKFEPWIAYYFAKNIGSGIKWFVSEKVALRVEYRFINYSEDPAANISFHKIFVGISIFPNK